MFRPFRRTRQRPRSGPSPDDDTGGTPAFITREPHVQDRGTNTAATSMIAIRELLTLAKESSDAFPPLKSVMGGINVIVTIIEVK